MHALFDLHSKSPAASIQQLGRKHQTFIADEPLAGATMRSGNVALFFLLACAASLASAEDPEKLGTVIGIDLGTTYS